MSQTTTPTGLPGQENENGRRWRARAPLIGYLLLMVAFAIMGYFIWDTIQQQAEDRRNGAIINCRNNQAQDDVLRAIFRPTIESDDPVPPEERIQLEHAYERVLGKTPGDKSVKQMRLELVEHLMAPLGGYKTNKKEQAKLCAERLRRSGIEPVR